jgi:protein-tyrosine-phosphatase
MNNTKKPWESGTDFERNRFPSFDNNDAFKSSFLTNILFLSKRGMSRAPLAREIMSELLEQTHLFGRVRTSSRGVTEAYDQCPIDARMSKFSSKLGFFLNGYSRFATIPDISNADIIITLDQESESFIRQNKSFVKGITRPIGIYLCNGSSPYVADPYERNDDEDIDVHYEEIASLIKNGCTKLFTQLPSLIS